MNIRLDHYDGASSNSTQLFNGQSAVTALDLAQRTNGAWFGYARDGESTDQGIYHVRSVDAQGAEQGPDIPPLELPKQSGAGPMDYALAADADTFAVAAVTRDSLVPAGAFTLAVFSYGAFSTLDGTTLQVPHRDYFPHSAPALATSADGRTLLLAFVDGNDAFPTSIAVLRAYCHPHESP